MTAVVPFSDLEPQLAEADEELREAVLRVVASRRYILGPEVEAFESLAAEYLGARYAVAVSSGTDALVMALLACGVKPGDEVVTPPFTFVATAEAIVRTGAVPRFVDVTEDSLCLDPALVGAAMTPRVRAFLPVHLYGHAADVSGLSAMAEEHGVPVVEDAAQALGTRMAGRSLGTWGNAGCFSFFPTKVLGALGDAGLVSTDDTRMAAALRSLRQHGLGEEARYVRLGGNFRMDAIQAAALSVLLPRLNRALDSRRAIAARYDASLLRTPGLSLAVRDPAIQWNGAIYTVRVADGRRAALQEHLSRAGIETRIYYELPLHLQPAFAHLGHRPGDFPVAERAATEVLSLPIYPSLSGEAVTQVVDATTSFLARAGGKSGIGH